MLFDIPRLALSLSCRPFHFDIGIPLPFGFLRASSNLGYIGIGFACLSWDFRQEAR